MGKLQKSYRGTRDTQEWKSSALTFESEVFEKDHILLIQTGLQTVIEQVVGDDDVRDAYRVEGQGDIYIR